jgi:hypothetical protein
MEFDHIPKHLVYAENHFARLRSMLEGGRRKWLWTAIAAWLALGVDSQADLPVCEVTQATDKSYYDF